MIKGFRCTVLVALLIVAIMVLSISVSYAGKTTKSLKITSQPKSVTVSEGTKAKVVLSAKGDGLTYKWYYKDKGKQKYTLSKVYKKASYTTTMKNSKDGRKVYCIIKDKYGNKKKTNIVTLHEGTTLKITKQPKTVAVLNGSKAKVSISAKGDGLTYKWYYKDKGKNKYTLSKAYKKTSYTTTMKNSKDGRKVYCIIKDKYGSKIKTKVVTLNKKTPLSITKQPKSIVAFSGDVVKVSVTAKGDGLTYKWYYKNPSKDKYIYATKQKTASYITTMNTDKDGCKIYCIIRDKYGKKIKSKTVMLHLKTPLKITKQPKSVTVGKGKKASVAVTATGDGLKYQWYSKSYNAKSFVKADGFTGDSYSLKMDSKQNGQHVYCKITDKYGKVVETNVVSLNMESLCEACNSKDAGIRFDCNQTYSQEKKLNKQPLTFEAVFQIDQEDVKNSQMEPLDTKAGYAETVLFSNDDSYLPCVTYSITEDGNPKLGLRNKMWYARSYNLVFDKVKVFSDRPIHMAITLDRDDDKAYCYIDGTLKQTLSDIPKEVKTGVETTFAYAVGGDRYDGNINYFRGELYQVGVWADIRTALEIKADYTAGIHIGDSMLMASYDLTLCSECMLQDKSAKDNDLLAEKLWLDKDAVEAVGEYDYSFAIVGDTQTLSEKDPAAFASIYRWIVNNKDDYKIEYMAGLGDVTQKSYAKEWEYARNQIYQLNEKIPYMLIRGNHDWDTVKNGTVTAGFNTTFNDGIYNQQLTGVMVENDLRNAYRTITIRGINYLFLTLDFGPNAQMLEWADSVIKGHPNHRVIVLTHGYLYRDGTVLDKEARYLPSVGPIKDRIHEQAEKPSLNGDAIWTQFISQHANIQLVVSGHVPSQHVVYRQDQGVNGNTVTQMLIDPQGIDDLGSTAMVAMFYFSNEGNTLTVRYYSVAKDMYGSERSQFTIDLS